jgi:hypothetical protein
LGKCYFPIARSRSFVLTRSKLDKLPIGRENSKIRLGSITVTSDVMLYVAYNTLPAYHHVKIIMHVALFLCFVTRLDHSMYSALLRTTCSKEKLGRLSSLRCLYFEAPQMNRRLISCCLYVQTKYTCNLNFCFAKNIHNRGQPSADAIERQPSV